jgi:hypothetical protein
MLPVDGAGVRGEQDRYGHEVVVEYLEGAVVPPVPPGPVVAEGGGEERRVIPGGCSTCGCYPGGCSPGWSADGHPRMLM